MTPSSWREQQKTFFAEKNIEFEQDQRIINWLIDTTTYVYGDNYFNQYVHRVDNIEEAHQCLIFVKNPIRSKSLETLLNPLINIPRVCIAINKFVIYTDTFTDVNEDYDIALLDYMKSIFKNRVIDYHYVPNVKGLHFNFASPTTQFFIT
jgi:hypothetical protein